MSTTATISPQAEVATAALKAVPAQEPPGQDLYCETIQQLPIQRKLSIGAVDDPLEEEADAMADKVMRMPEAPFIQRKCAHCEEEEKVQRRPLAVSITPFIQTKGGEGDTASDSLTNQVNATRGSGSNMDKPTQSFMENRFGAGFSNIQIHTDGNAVQMNRELNAKAFTVGNDIYFNEGQYNPNSGEGKYLLAHELTHTVQQGSTTENIQRACGNTEIGDPAGCIGNSMAVPETPRYLFNTNCDTLSAADELRLRTDALSMQNDEEIDIHGLASEEGTINFNVRLSCARALRARTIIEEVLRTRGVTVTIRVFSHGPQPGYRPINRSVALVRRTPSPFPVVVENQEAVHTRPQSCSGVYTDGHHETDDGDHDLDQAHHGGERSPDVIVYDDIFGEGGALSDFSIGFFAGTMGESTNNDDMLFNHFVAGNGARMNFTSSMDMAAIIGSSPTFTNFATGLEAAVQAHIAATGTLCGFNGNAYLAANRPPYFHSPLFAWAVMGGYARIDASVRQPAHGGIEVMYTIYDHYGAGVSDAWSYLPGLSAMYYLQHFHGFPGRRYMPFIWSVQINRTSP